MKKDHILYFDSGTSNTRAYLLDREFRICDSAKRAVGSKDSAIAGTNRVLIEGMKALYDQVLAANSLTDGDVEAIYASGMVTSPLCLLSLCPGCCGFLRGFDPLVVRFCCDSPETP